MNMKRLCLYFFVGLMLISQVDAQHAFSKDKAIFYTQVQSKLRSLGTEAASKVAYDFSNAWNGKFTSAQQDKIHQIALSMERRGDQFYPYFWYYFSYLAYSTAQAGITTDQITKVLEINEKMLTMLTKEEYRNFLLGLNTWMARRILWQTRNILVRTDDGAFEFKLIDGQSVTIDQPAAEEQLSEEPAQDTWDSQDNSWANDPWSTDTSWGDDAKKDYDDNWVQDENFWGYDMVGEVQTEKGGRQFVQAVEQDHAANARARYIHPVIEGPLIELINNNMVIATPYDTLKIKETSGSFLLKNRVYAGENAVINWPGQNKLAKGAVVNLDQFYMRADRSEFWTPNARMTFENMFSGTIDGVFSFKSQKRGSFDLSEFPVFTSFEANIDVKLPYSNMKYHGGIQISGNQLAGTAVSRKRGRLTIMDGKGHEAILRGVRFDFKQDSSVYSAEASITVKTGRDSLYHPSVEVFYDGTKRELVLLRTKKFDVTPFTSTFFDVNINAEIIKWNMEGDSINFSIMNGKDLIPVVIESKDFFNQVRYSRLEAGLPFHPVSAAVFYANKYNTREFAVSELVTAYNIPLNQAKAAMRVLEQYGFATYNHDSGIVKLTDKAFFYYKASGMKVDFDNLLIPSLEPKQPNATWRLDSGQVAVRGVKRYYLTSDFQIYAEPADGRLILEENRSIRFNGMLHAGEFEYNGRDFRFDYDGFFVELKQVDSLHIQVDTPDSLMKQGAEKRTNLANQLNETSGILYLDDPNNKSAKRHNSNYPNFSSDSEAVVYFDGPEILGGAYDRSVKFVIPPYESDSIEATDNVSFEGEFNSGGIFPNFKETLSLQRDQSLGFIHEIPEEGYNLYGTSAKTYERVTLNSQGIRGTGEIDFITAKIFSKDFVYYPDSVAAYGTGGFIEPGDAFGSSYPEARLGAYRMHWEPRIDSMHLTNIREPFKFYHATAELDGAVNITQRGVYGSGEMHTRGSLAISKDLTFKEKSYAARHADFQVLTDNPRKPAMAGEDIRLNFDLINNTAVIQPEKTGVAAISFPYAQMKTSITNAVWDLEDSVVTMTKPANVPLKDSYFYTTRKDLDSLSFYADRAEYDLNTKKLKVSGIPYIIVADTRIIPENHETTILENSELQSFRNAKLIIDTLKGYHYLYDGEIKIVSRNEYVGTAMYRLVTGRDTFGIKFDRFYLSDEHLANGKVKKMTISGGEVLAKQKVLIAPGFYYKGNAKMYAVKPALELDGSVKLVMKNPAYDYWIQYKRPAESQKIEIDMETARFDDEDEVIAGLHYDLKGTLYPTFAEKRRYVSDVDFFLPKGILSYDTTDIFRIESPAKTSGESYEGSTMIYNDATKDILFEGRVNFFGNGLQPVQVNASVLGSGNGESSQYDINAFLAIDYQKSNTFFALMAKDLIDIIERLGPPQANDLSVELMYNLANMTSNSLTKAYETASLKDYKPLFSISDNLNKSLVISGVKMKWSKPQSAWYNTTKLGISNIYDVDVNSKLDGFLEIRKDETNSDVLNIFIQAAPGTWYFISYAANTLLMYSSNSAFNEEVKSKSNQSSAKAGEWVTMAGDESDVLTFVNHFREVYFGITEPYNLVSPTDANLEEDDENFDTIQKEEDDGFGF